MSGDTTYGMLDRLTYLSDRDALENGLVIAGQPWYDVYFTGGFISGVTLQDVAINGFSSFLTYRVITSSGDVNVLETDNVIIMNKTVGAATIVYLPVLDADANQIVIVKDGKGDADTHNITVNGNGNSIDGNANYVLGAPYGWIFVIWNGSQWNQIG